MTTSAALDQDEIVARLREIAGDGRVETDQQVLRSSSVDRFKKYTAVHGIFDGPLPCAVVRVADVQQAAAVLAFADEHRINVVARTGRTGTEGGLETGVEGTIVLDGSEMSEIVRIDEENMQATAQCGVPLQVLEDALRERGLTTGHSPQSKPLAQMGGLVATRSIGQFSTLYGGIEDMVVGLEAVFPDGSISRIKNVPRRAAGPDIRHVVIGNEGALCFVSEVTVKVFKHRPENNRFQGYLIDDVHTGLSILREVITEGFRPSVARVYSEEDAAQHFSHFANGKCVLLFVSEGPAGIVEATGAEIERVVSRHEHAAVDPGLIESWFDNLNWGPDKIEAEQRAMLTEQRLGYTTEISADWSSVGAIYDAVMHRIRTEFPHADDVTMLGGHSSHSYQTGTNMYFVYDYRIRCEPREEIEKYHKPINAIIVEEALRHGGSMVHHHGIGKYRAQWTEQEHGSAYPMLVRLKEAFDPNGIMNRGTIFPAG
ncbi:FAD-binding oxidoreductase [Saccharopolyspora dendranthemae]|uniref:Alkyldihydroxyacetonephosphate synthase n=1 Tax=Saccharopolyspora dendranthemae TaxID=1181886 RepID=A0A561U8C2_9PSEU|nr:FAD-binding oxidoreductase [Saccharopolyspora dendranthemae]TWF95605.1 alkyldihydroxyacetonephosphate synthase [Saccharopolyspora dendranthemae]